MRPNAPWRTCACSSRTARSRPASASPPSGNSRRPSAWPGPRSVRRCGRSRSPDSIQSVRGVGNFVVEAAPERPRPAHLTSQVLAFTGSALEEMRRLVEGGGAALAAERATAEQCIVLAEEVSNLYAAVGDPPLFLVHDVRFHRAVAAASGNPLLASAVDQLTEAALDRARGRVPLASADALRHMAATHRRIYHAIRDHDAGRARAEMEAHLAVAVAVGARPPGDCPIGAVSAPITSSVNSWRPGSEAGCRGLPLERAGHAVRQRDDRPRARPAVRVYCTSTGPRGVGTDAPTVREGARCGAIRTVANPGVAGSDAGDGGEQVVVGVRAPRVRIGSRRFGLLGPRRQAEVEHVPPGLERAEVFVAESGLCQRAEDVELEVVGRLRERGVVEHAADEGRDRRPARGPRGRRARSRAGCTSSSRGCRRRAVVTGPTSRPSPRAATAIGPDPVRAGDVGVAGRRLEVRRLAQREDVLERGSPTGRHRRSGARRPRSRGRPPSPRSSTTPGGRAGRRGPRVPRTSRGRPRRRAGSARRRRCRRPRRAGRAACRSRRARTAG